MSDKHITEQAKVPQREFLLMLIIMLRKCEMETDMPLLTFLESFEEENPNWNPDDNVDSYDDAQLRGAVRKFMNYHYPPEKLRKQLGGNREET